MLEIVYDEKVRKYETHERVEIYLGSKYLNTGIFDIPTKLSCRPGGTAKIMSIVDDIFKIVFPPRGLIQPHGSP